MLIRGKSGKTQLDWANHKLRSTDNDWRRKSSDRYNKKETKEMYRTQTQRSFTAKNGNPMKNGSKEYKKQFIVSVILQ